MAAEKEPATIAPQGIPHNDSSAKGFLIHKVTSADSLEKLAAKLGISWKNLAKFNWGTDKAAEVNWYLHNCVGSTNTLDGQNYTFADTAKPGLIYLPAASAATKKKPVSKKASGLAHHVVISAPPLKLEVTEVAFHDDYDLRKWPGGALISGPVWKKTASPDLPVCYKKASKGLKLKIKVRVVGGNTKKPITLRACGLTGSAHGNPDKLTGLSALLTFEKKGVSVSKPDFEVSDITLSGGELSDNVMSSKLALRWAYSLDNTVWYDMGTTGPHLIHQVKITPMEAPLYDLAVDKACKYVNGDSKHEEKLCEGIAKEINYNPAHDVSGNPLRIYAVGQCQCSNNADLMRYLLRSIGIDAKVVWIWGGQSASKVLFYHGVSGVFGSFRVIVPANDLAVANPHFTFHVETEVGADTYDPSYGTKGLITLDETASGASRQTGKKSDYTGASFYEVDPTVWKCPH